MEDNDFEEVTVPKKEIEVFYVPDEIIEIIIPNDSKKSEAKRKTQDFYVSGAYNRTNGTPNIERERYTRSGRKITSKLQFLTLNDSPEKRRTSLEVDENDDFADVEFEKPSDNLFEEEEDVDGKMIFSFRTPKSQNGMINKASESVKSTINRPQERERKERSRPVNEASPVSPFHSSENIPKTPYGLRNQLRKRLADEAEKQELDRLLENSESDYVPTDSESESDTSDSTDDEDATPMLPSPVKSPVKKSTQGLSMLPKKTKKQMKDYVFQSDDYFYRKHAKIITSNNTLSKLKNPKLAPSQLAKLLKSIPKTHVESYDNLIYYIESSFKRWLFAFRDAMPPLQHLKCPNSVGEGFNVMLYGLGSKSDILNRFHEQFLKNSYVFKIKGYFPDNMIKEVFNSVATTYLKMSAVPTHPHEIIDLLAEKMKSKISNRLFILISNLDGMFLQNDKAQTLLSQLASLPKVHLLATVDHINSALLWDQSKLSKFNFIWEDATTFKPYTEETSFEGSLMVQWSGEGTIASLKSVFSSLTINSRKVFKILLNHHLENKSPKYSGMHFSELYRECRAGFVVSSDLALRTLLTEFMDHQLVKWRKETDHLLITVDTPVLIQFQSEIDLLN